MEHAVFCGWLLSLCKVLSRFVCATAYVRPFLGLNSERLGEEVGELTFAQTFICERTHFGGCDSLLAGSG